MHPLIVRQVIFPLHERIKGKATYAWLKKLESTQWLAPQRLQEMQLEALKSHLEYAYRQVPYYRELFDRCAVQPARIKSLADFSHIPFLSKETIRTRFADLKARAHVRGIQKISTGGSTGNPVTVLVDSARTAFTDAARMRAQRWLRADFGEREIVLWGSPIEVTKQDRVRQIRDWLINSRLLSAFDLSENALARYADYLHRFRPQKLYGYASALTLLAGYLKKTGQPAGPGWPRAVFTTAEPLFDFQRELIEEAFQCPVAVEYGARDAGLIAHECQHGKLHLNAEGILVEIVGDEGSHRDGRGEIVVTNLQSYAMPLIRYRTGDVGTLEPSACPCGRGLPVLGKVEGRQTDFLVATDGRLLHALAIIYVLREIPSVREFQVFQESLNQLVVRLVPEPEFSEADRAAIIRKAKSLLGEQVEVTLQKMTQIDRLPSGKFRYVISQVADAYLARMVPGSRANSVTAGSQ